MEDMSRSVRQPRGGHDEVVRITTARESADADRRTREVRYLVSMAIRVVCFVGAILVGPGWLRWVLVAGAVLLPYVAVVMANAKASPADGIDLPTGLGESRELGPRDR